MPIMSTIATVVALALGAPQASSGLETLATTGWADDFAAEVKGKAFDETGGSPFAGFTYADEAGDTSWMEVANELLDSGEFLAPHFADVHGMKVIMVAPHLIVDGEVVKGAGEPDNFIVVYGGDLAERFDYSNDVDKM